MDWTRDLPVGKPGSYFIWNEYFGLNQAEIGADGYVLYYNGNKRIETGDNGAVSEFHQRVKLHPMDFISTYGFFHWFGPIREPETPP